MVSRCAQHTRAPHGFNGHEGEDLEGRMPPYHAIYSDRPAKREQTRRQLETVETQKGRECVFNHKKADR